MSPETSNVHNKKCIFKVFLFDSFLANRNKLTKKRVRE